MALKWLIYCACIIVLGIGSVLVWVGFLVQSSPFIQVLEYSYSGFIVIACGGILIFIAFIGIIGAWKQRKFFLTLFIISSLIIGILLITFGGVLIYVRNLSQTYLKDQASCQKYFPKADNTSVLASKVFCKLYCPCSLDASVAASLGFKDFYKGSAISTIVCNPCESIQTYNASVQLELQAWVNNTLGYSINSTDCGVTTTQYEDAYYTSVYEKYIPLVTWIEQQFLCSGLCTKLPIYYFSDITVGLPTTSCYKAVGSWAQKNFLNYGIVSIVLGLYEISIIYFACALCLCPKRRLDLPPSALNSPGKNFEFKGKQAFSEKGGN